MANVIGIDLGTTNSVAAFKFAEVEVVTADDNTPPDRKLTRSVVGHEQSKLAVGDRAYNQLRVEPENVIVSIKRLMGRGFGDAIVQQQLSRFGYKITKPTQGTDNSISVWLGNQEYQPEDISAEILKKVVKNAQNYFQAIGKREDIITQAVITVPAYFNDKQRHATRTAAIRAGLTLRELLPEPTAAAISYGFNPDESADVKTILVYDFGGGTFDASLITVAGNQFIELGKSGDLWLGGDDLDYLIVEYVKAQVAKEEGLNNIDNLIAKMPYYQRVRCMGDLKLAVERAKIDLSSVNSTNIIPSTPLLDELGMAVPINVELSREKFEEMIEPIVTRSIQICRDALKLSEYTNDQIDIVLLVGGSSQIPLVQRLVSQAFGADKVVIHPRPMYAVAEGAAIVAAGLTEKVGTVSRDYFIKLIDNSSHKVISRGDILPVTTFHTFKTVADGQRLIHFEFYSPDRVSEDLDRVERDEKIGDIWLGLDQYYPQDTEVFVTLELDEKASSLQVTAALKNDPSVKVSSSFSRGRVDEQIFRELEQAIQDLNDAQNLTDKGVNEANNMATKIVKAANQIIDRDSGKERSDRRLDAEKELDRFKAFASEDRDKAELYSQEFQFLVETCPSIIPEPQRERMENISLRLKNAVERNDYSGMQAITEEAEREVKNLPDEVMPILASKAAIQRANVTSPAQAKIMGNKLSQMLAAIERDDGNMANQIWRDLSPDVRRWLDEDLPIATIVTGLTR